MSESIRKPSALKIWGGLTILFAAGIIVGIIGTKFVIRHKFEEIFLNGPIGLLPFGVEQIDANFHLRPDQRASAMAILLEAAAKNNEFRRPIRESQRQLVKDTAKRLYALLDPEQQKLAELDNIIREIDKRMDRVSELDIDKNLQQKMIDEASR